MIRLDTRNLAPYLTEARLAEHTEPTMAAHKQLVSGTGAGAEYLGWRALLADPNDALLSDIVSLAGEIRDRADVFVSIGIGGSYLGAQAVIRALTPYFRRDGEPEILFAGHQMSGAYLSELLERLDGRSVYVNVISKSGTTLEPAIAFRLIRSWMEARFDDAARRIVITTDPDHGALNALRSKEGYRRYVIPPSVGGRFSVLTPVGLLPAAVAGLDIRSLFYGARTVFEQLGSSPISGDGILHDALRYAAARHILQSAGYHVEVFAVFEERLADIGGWWQQLFGESEGKQGVGLYPTTVRYSSDLHSLGQYLQDGRRVLIETFLMAEEDGGDLMVPSDAGNADGLNYLAGRTLTDVNRKAYEATAVAHGEGGVPNMTLWIEDITAEHIGGLLYFFEHAVAVSAYLLGVNPFDQPGVEAYKQEMFKRLGRP